MQSPDRTSPNWITCLVVALIVALTLGIGAQWAFPQQALLRRASDGFGEHEIDGVSTDDADTTLTIELDVKMPNLEQGAAVSGSTRIVTGRSADGKLQYALASDLATSGSAVSVIPPIELISGDIGFNIAPLADVTNPDTSDTLVARRMSDGANVEVQIGHLPFSGGTTLTPPAENQVAYGNVGGTDIESSSNLVYDPVNGTLTVTATSGDKVALTPGATNIKLDIDAALGAGSPQVRFNKADGGTAAMRFVNNGTAEWALAMGTGEAFQIQLLTANTRAFNFTATGGGVLDLQYNGQPVLFSHSVGASRTSNLTLTAGSSTTIPLSSATLWEDVSTQHDPSGDPNKIYYRDSNRSGVVVFSGFAQINASTDNNTYLMQVLKNGTPVWSEPPDYFNLSGSVFEIGTISGMVEMTNGDYLELNVYQNSGANRTLTFAHFYFGRLGD